MSERRLIVRSVGFSEDTIDLGFNVLPFDLRDVAGHQVLQMRTFVLSRKGDAYADEIAALVEAAEALVDDVLDDWPTATPVAEQEEDDDDDRGMGFG